MTLPASAEPFGDRLPLALLTDWRPTSFAASLPTMR